MVTFTSAPDTAKALAAPFPESEVRYLPGAVSGNRALAMPYITARTVMERLDAVLGIDGWKDSYDFLEDGSVVCRLSCKLGDVWIEKADVGGASEQKDAGDRRKAAFSDALKRAAVKFGIGRYLFQLPRQWRDYDPQRKQFVTGTRPAAAQPSQPAAASGAVRSRPPARQTELAPKGFDEYGYPRV